MRQTLLAMQLMQRKRLHSASKAARKTAGSFKRALKNTIETQPYTAVVVALGIGWFLGRMHRPL